MSKNQDSARWVRTDPIEAIAEVFETFISNRNKQTLGHAWAATLDVDVIGGLDYFDKGAQVMRLCGRASEAADAIAPDSHDLGLTLKEMRVIVASLSTPHVKPSAVANQAVGVLPKLRLISLLVRQAGGGITYDEDALLSVMQELDGLVESVLAADLPDEVIQVIVRRIRALREAVLEMRMRGLDDVRDAVDAAVGTLITNRVADTDPDLSSKIGAVLMKVVSVVAGASATANTAIEAIKLLTGG